MKKLHLNKEVVSEMENRKDSIVGGVVTGTNATAQALTCQPADTKFAQVCETKMCVLPTAKPACFSGTGLVTCGHCVNTYNSFCNCGI